MSAILFRAAIGFHHRDIASPPDVKVRNGSEADIETVAAHGQGERVDRDEDAILQHILASIEWLVGRRPEYGPDALIGADFRVEGWDGIELLEGLEATYDVDLRPFVDARSTTRRFLFWKLRVAGDATPRELAKHIAALLSGR